MLVAGYQQLNEISLLLYSNYLGTIAVIVYRITATVSTTIDIIHETGMETNHVR